jgi:acetyltransferase-like isoleucine patch superfamily enzyme
MERDGAIGKGSLIANYVAFVGRYGHDWRHVGLPIVASPWIGNPEYQGSGAGKRIQVGSDVWTGHDAVVLGGTNVGRGAIVAAGSVVTKDVAPHDIAAGNPARSVGERPPEGERAENERLPAERWGIGG